MAYAIRYHSAAHGGTLCEMPARKLSTIIAAQRTAADAHEAWHDTPECARPHPAPAAPAWPQYEAASAADAHRWVKSGAIHETALWVDCGKVRRA